MLEVKWENTINRVTGTAVHPRPRERVTAGTEFEFEMIFRIFDSTDKVQPDDLTLFKKFLRSFECDMIRSAAPVHVDAEK